MVLGLLQRYFTIGVNVDRTERLEYNLIIIYIDLPGFFFYGLVFFGDKMGK
jgi:hypothetical protein